MQDYDFDRLCQLAFQSWLDRGQPMDTPGFDKDFARSQFGAQSFATQVNDQYAAVQHSMAEGSDDE